ncbi:MAG: pyridoxal phosphate-dependent aminotransferase [candidate division Zixibacteria bacterium]
MIRKLVLEKADRLYHLPSIVDDFLPRKTKRKVIRHEILDLARFKWRNEPDPQHNSNSLTAASEIDLQNLSQKTADWYLERFGAKIIPAKEIYIGGSIRQILVLFSLAYLNPGDLLLIPDPGIWHYRAAAALASAEAVPYHLLERNDCKPALSGFSESLIRVARGMVLNSTHNPTGQSLNKEDLTKMVRTARKENLILILDQAFEGFKENDHSASLFSVPGGRKVGLELYSYSYNFGKSLPSLGFAIGQPALISSLKHIASRLGILPISLQINDAIGVFDNYLKRLNELKAHFAHNRELADQLCDKLRIMPARIRQGPFYWAKLPGRKQSRRFCRLLYLRCGILVLPGIAFGENGEGFIRFSLTPRPEVYEKAISVAGGFFQKTRKSVDG